MQDETTANDETRFKRWAIRVGVIGTGIFVSIFVIFLFYNAFFPTKTDNWFLQMVASHPAATVGFAMSAITSFCVVSVFELRSGQMEMEIPGVKFKGASGPVIFWIACFLAGVWAHTVLWPLH